MIEVSAPSNIALIKYMGKTETSGNRPANGSLSYTLNHLLTQVRIQPLPDGEDTLDSLNASNFRVEMSPQGKIRFLNFFKYLKDEFGLKGVYGIQSGNNFPSDCGLASSASSFAALTLATYTLARRENKISEQGPEFLSRLSQRGSGSSCRSFFSPFSIWRDRGAESIDVGVDELHHTVLILEGEKKKVSSSEAHRRVTSSLQFRGRGERAELRLKHLIEAFRHGDWLKAYEICWQEFWDMHALFETSTPTFGYMNGTCIQILSHLRERWQREGDGPLITMDAGPNIHLLFRRNQNELRAKWLKDLKLENPKLQVMSDI